ncbi:HU family DNA-binding protein [Halorubrum salinarum]|uniref:HU family DNA-binding protein n=1 Tax=Halorubrum salinarum TaxID=2739057 RepID=A0A7D3YBY0_9EURY|nr:HU family DNA-binding protein [Halorubrum salinarum]QKG93925.1 HU family DNA-binding protein [Halorubrum salinarum]
MNGGKATENGIARRTVLRRGALVSAALGLGVAAGGGGAAASKRPELVEAIAVESGLSPRDAARGLDAITGAVTAALRRGDSAQVEDFGRFSISKRSARTGRNPRSDRGGDDSPVTFDPCPAFAAALDLNPGRGDVASAKCRDADVWIDAESVASDTGRSSDQGLAAREAARLLDALVTVTANGLQGGGTVVVSEAFGSFGISKRSARTGRNPQTGKRTESAAKNEVKFKAGAELSGQVN